MKRLIAPLAAAFAGSLALAGCGTAESNDAHADSTPDFGDCTITSEVGTIDLETVSEDTLTVVTVLPNPGWWNGTNPESTKSGYEYCLAADIANRAGLKSITLRNLAWDQYISGTATDYDIALAATMITDEREEIFDFSDPYFEFDLGVATQKDAEVTPDNLADQSIGVIAGNLGAEYASTVIKPVETLKTFQTLPDLFTALQSGQVDAVVIDTSLALAGVKPSNGALEVPGRLAVDRSYGVVMPSGTPNREAVNEAISAVTTDGTLDRFMDEYLVPEFGVDPETIPVWNEE